jgi:Transmembrane protein 43
MSDTFTEVTTKSWGSRLFESIKGVLFGLALIVGACVALFWNEGRVVQTQRSLTEGAGVVVDIDPARVDPANDGKLVHASGEMKAPAPVFDPEFGVSANGLRLMRVVEMYQWKEDKKTETRKNFGGSEETVTTYSYGHEWSETRIDSRDFKQPDGHVNPQMRYQGTAVLARDVSFGAFRPNARVVEMLPASEKVRVETALADTVRTRIGWPVSVNDGVFYLGADAAKPAVGDLRISYRLVPAGPVSIIGQEQGTDFNPYQTKAGDRLLMVRPGTLSAADMFKEAQRENAILTWVIRFVGALVMFFGFALVLNPLVVVADVVPFIGSVLGAGAALVSLIATAMLAPVVIAIAWFWYRPLVSLAVLALGFAASYGLKRLAARKVAAAPLAAPAH